MAGGATLISTSAKAGAIDTNARRPVVVLGSTSALVRAVANGLAARGHPLILAARNKAENQLIAADIAVRHGVEVMPVELAASNFETHEDFFQDCLNRAGEPLAGVVLGFGFMEDQKRAQANHALARETIDTNFTAAVSLLERFADRLEDQGNGFIAVIGSVAGDRGRQSNYLYGAAKGGLAVYLEGLRNRLYPAGVHVMTVKPGFIDTKMTWGLPGLFLVASPEAAARGFLSALDKRRNVAYIPAFWWVIMLIIRHIPETIFKRLKL